MSLRSAAAGPLTAMLLAATGCCPAVPAVSALPPGAAGVTRWRQARATLTELRERYQADEPYSMNVTLELTQLQLGQRMRARGTVAVMPPHALRMILLGPGGTTALDLWICDDRYRFSVPAIDLERRGDRNTPAEQQRGLPVGFLRWWFLQPLAGRLLSVHPSAAPTAPGEHFVLRDGHSIVHLHHPAGTSEELPLQIERHAGGDAERMRVSGSRCGKVHYDQRSTGLSIDVSCEKLNVQPPPARAFADPDHPSQPCGPVDG